MITMIATITTTTRENDYVVDNDENDDNDDDDDNDENDHDVDNDDNDANDGDDDDDAKLQVHIKIQIRACIRIQMQILDRPSCRQTCSHLSRYGLA